jgi:Uma2 family endonuclease
MATGALISEEEYLHTSYEPDCEYEDGVLIERNVGLEDHSDLQRGLIVYFSLRRKAWKIRVYPELRVKCRDGKYMIPDVCVVSDSTPREPILTTPPVLWIEILSSDDRHVRVSKKVKDVLASGCPYVWVIDPKTLESELHTAQGSMILTDGVLRIPGTEIVVPLREVLED